MRPTRLIAPTAAALAAAAGSSSVALAFFGDRSASGGSAASGTIALGGDLSPTATVNPLLSAADLQPGQTRTGNPVRVVNAGTATALLRVRREAPATADALGARLTVLVDHCADSACASVTSTTARTQAQNDNIELGRLVPAAATWLRFSVRWVPAADDHTVLGRSTKITMRVNLLSLSTPASA